MSQVKYRVIAILTFEYFIHCNGVALLKSYMENPGEWAMLQEMRPMRLIVYLQKVWVFIPRKWIRVI